MELTGTLEETFEWRGRRVRWGRAGSGPPVVMCHGTPWSSWLWQRYADALTAEYSVHLWDMPGYGRSSKEPDHAVGLDVQGELLADLINRWDLGAPHVIAHDFGGAVALRAHLLHGARYSSMALVDVVALAPWGSEFFRLVHDHAEVFTALPPAVHEGAVRAYISGASHHGLADRELDRLVEPWLGPEGQQAFYRQIAQSSQAFTDQIEPRYGNIDVPTLVVWGEDDTWLPVEQGRLLAATIPGADLVTVPDAGHLIHLDAPVALMATLERWLARVR